jgi:hypothetical protein
MHSAATAAVGCGRIDSTSQRQRRHIRLAAPRTHSWLTGRLNHSRHPGYSHSLTFVSPTVVPIHPDGRPHRRSPPGPPERPRNTTHASCTPMAPGSWADTAGCGPHGPDCRLAEPPYRLSARRHRLSVPCNTSASVPPAPPLRFVLHPQALPTTETAEAAGVDGSVVGGSSLE